MIDDIKKALLNIQELLSSVITSKLFILGILFGSILYLAFTIIKGDPLESTTKSIRNPIPKDAYVTGVIYQKDINDYIIKYSPVSPDFIVISTEHGDTIVIKKEDENVK